MRLARLTGPSGGGPRLPAQNARLRNGLDGRATQALAMAAEGVCPPRHSLGAAPRRAARNFGYALVLNNGKLREQEATAELAARRDPLLSLSRQRPRGAAGDAKEGGR